MASTKITSAAVDSPSVPQKGRCRLCRTFGRTEIAISNGDVQLVKCKACGVGFVDPLPSPASIATHFKEHYITDDLRLEQVYGELRREALTLIAAQVQRRKSGGRVLDIGCAGGYFLDRYFRSVEWQKFGVEPSRYAVRRALERNIRTYEGEVLSVDLPAQFFDVITVAGVLPYFRDPREELRVLRHSLKPDGLLVLELPLGATQVWRHTTTLGRMTGGGTRSIFDSPHLFFYDSSSLRLLLRETGFREEGMLPSPGNRQTHKLQDLLFGSYYRTSRLLSWLSRGIVTLGPGLIMCAAPVHN
jgi:SAM-dependent methyltransferase